MVPACSGGAITKSLNHSEHSSWVTHIAPDPADPNPKLARAIVDDLVSLVLPASNESCPSAWPMPDSIAENHCFVMSANLRWFLPDVQKWRLPNWGNWAIQYKHPRHDHELRRHSKARQTRGHCRWRIAHCFQRNRYFRQLDSVFFDESLIQPTTENTDTCGDVHRCWRNKNS